MSLVDKASGVDKFDCIQCSTAAITLITTSVLVATVRANSFDKTICKESKAIVNLFDRIGVESILTSNSPRSKSALSLVSLGNHVYRDSNRSLGRFCEEKSQIDVYKLFE